MQLNKKHYLIGLAILIIIFLFRNSLLTYFNLNDNDVVPNNAIISHENIEVKYEMEKKIKVTLYFAKWCPHCTRFMQSTWVHAKESLDVKKFQFNQVDCSNDNEQKIRTDNNQPIDGYPTIIVNYEANGEQKEISYEGKRDIESFSNYLNNL